MSPWLVGTLERYEKNAKANVEEFDRMSREQWEELEKLKQMHLPSDIVVDEDRVKILSWLVLLEGPDVVGDSPSL